MDSLHLCRAELVLLQNTLIDISEDELAALGDDDSAPTAPDTRKDSSLSELQSFVDLVYTHGRSVTSLQWLPHRKVPTFASPYAGLDPLHMLTTQALHL